MIVHAGIVRLTPPAVAVAGAVSVRASSLVAPSGCPATPTRFPAGSLNDARSRGPSGVGS